MLADILDFNIDITNLPTQFGRGEEYQNYPDKQ